VLNDADLAKIFMVVSSALLGSTALFAWLWTRARERALRAELERRPQLDPMVDLQTLAHTVDAMAIEVERIAEGQRFTTRLLTERKDGVAAPANRPPERVITPH